MKQEAGAGGIIFRRREGVIEFFFVKHGKTGRWTFPKGHQELGETLIETAIREIREEAGLERLRYVASIGKTSFRYRRERDVIQKTVHFFLFEAAPDAKEVLTGEEAIWEAIWVPETRVYETVGYQNLRRLLARARHVVHRDEEIGAHKLAPLAMPPSSS